MQCTHHCVSIHTSSCCKAWHWHDAGLWHAAHCAWAARCNTWLLIKQTPKGVNFSLLFFFAGHSDAGSHGDASAAPSQRLTPAGCLPVRSCFVDGHALCCWRLSHPHPQQEVPWGEQLLQHLHNVETHFYCPQTFLYLRFQCIVMSFLNKNRRFGIEKS